MSALRLGVIMKGRVPYVNAPVEISDLMEVFQAQSQYKACFFLKFFGFFFFCETQTTGSK